MEAGRPGRRLIQAGDEAYTRRVVVDSRELDELEIPFGDRVDGIY